MQAWPFGDLFVLDALWQHLGLPRAIANVRRDHPRLGFDVERALVANRAYAPAPETGVNRALADGLGCGVAEARTIGGWDPVASRRLWRPIWLRPPERY